MLKGVVKIFGGDPNKKAIQENFTLVNAINELEESYEQLSDEDLRAKTAAFKARQADGESLEDLLVEAFATVREASKRTLGLRHYDVQLIGGVVLHEGKVAEMKTGEGKTLVATLAVYLNALTGNGVHLVTVNDYLARRDARWMAPIYDFLGLSVGVLQMAARTENGRKAFLVDLKKEASQEDQHQLVLVDRKQAYQADVTYGTNNEFGFDYLRDNMTMRLEARTQRGHHYAVIDEVDNVLIDEARTPLIISGPAHDDTETFGTMSAVVKRLKPHDYEVNERDRNVTLTEIGEATVERILNTPLRDPERPEDITHEQARLLGFLEQALRAQFLFRRNKEYLVQAGKVIIIDESTGRLMPGRRWSDGLHQAVEAKEGVKVEGENATYATITIQNYFRMYEKLAGMTGTALTEAEEFDNIYKLDVLPIPPNVEYNATRDDAPLVALEDKDEYGYKYRYYADRDDDEQTPVYWKRKDYPDVVYRTEEIKLRAIVREILQIHVLGRPILIGTTSVENSEQLYNRLRADQVRKLAQVLVLRHVWLEANDREEDGRLIMALSYLNDPLEKLDINRMRKMARQLEISLNPEDEKNIVRLLDILDLEPQHQDRLTAVLRGGIPQQVLNARKHTEESQIIAGAGAFGAVTIATNMAGRGVDIKLGGDIAEELLSTVSRVLRRAGYDEPYDMTLDERVEALEKIDSEDYGIYESEIKFFIQSIEDMRKVKELGGLHVIGSERHSARRIDNQLRGRAARQGDPGSSRFYLSMEDELMRLFGGQQMDSMMQRMKVDDAMPMEMGLVSKIIEGAQNRVEGANFDRRKHVLEYDDVLNSQRASIYGQRDRIFRKADLNEDVHEMLQIEIANHVPAALEDEEGPWRLLAWLGGIQPTFVSSDVIFPSFALKLLMDYVQKDDPTTKEAVLDKLLDLAEASLRAQEEHYTASIAVLADEMQANLDTQLEERLELIDTFFEGLQYSDETDTRNTSDLVNELSSLMRFPIKLTNHQQRQLRDEPYEIEELIGSQLEDIVTLQMVTRLVGAAERRLEKSLELNAAELAKQDWEQIGDAVLSAIAADFESQHKTLIGADRDGQIARDMRLLLDKVTEINEKVILGLLMQMPQGAVAAFDKKTHRRVMHRTKRLTYDYFAAQFLREFSVEEITEMVLEHLDGAQTSIQDVWGVSQWERISKTKFEELDQKTKSSLSDVLAIAESSGDSSRRLEDLVDGNKDAVIDALGRLSLTEIYRELLLKVISDLWVEYLTRIEGLRVSIGLEAYGQRDPLTQYKLQATQMFQELLSDVRLGVVARMFVFQPRTAAPASQLNQPPTVPQGSQVQVQVSSSADGAPKRKRKRKRKRKKKAAN